MERYRDAFLLAMAGESLTCITSWDYYEVLPGLVGGSVALGLEGCTAAKSTREHQVRKQLRCQHQQRTWPDS